MQTFFHRRELPHSEILSTFEELKKRRIMLAYTYIEHGKFSLLEKPVPQLKDPKDALVRVTSTSNTGVYRVPFRALR